MFDNRINWDILKTNNIFFNFFPKSYSTEVIQKIVEKRETTFNSIKSFLNVEFNNKIKLYFTPCKKVCLSIAMPYQAAFPSLSVASLTTNGIQENFEEVHYGHEICHLIAYFLDRERYHIEFLEEGLAVYLDQSGENKHIGYGFFILNHSSKIREGFSVRISNKRYLINRAKAGSFVKYIIEHYDIETFKDLYTSSKLTLNGSKYVTSNGELREDYLKELIEKIYKKPAYIIEEEWYYAVVEAMRKFIIQNNINLSGLRYYLGQKFINNELYQNNFFKEILP